MIEPWVLSSQPWFVLLDDDPCSLSLERDLEALQTERHASRINLPSNHDAGSAKPRRAARSQESDKVDVSHLPSSSTLSCSPIRCFPRDWFRDGL